MAETIILNRAVYGANSFGKVVDTRFKQLAPPTPEEEEEITVEQFFELYDRLFFQIPVFGEFNSHEYLVKRSSEYIGADTVSDTEQALLEEINSLRAQLLESNKAALQLSKFS